MGAAAARLLSSHWERGALKRDQNDALRRAMRRPHRRVEIMRDRESMGSRLQAADLEARSIVQWPVGIEREAIEQGGVVCPG